MKPSLQHFLKWLKIAAVLLIAGLGSGLHAQNIPQLLRDYHETDRQITRETAALDSLNTLLAKQTARIEAQKQQPNPDKGELRSQMAEGLELSEKINRQRRTVDALQTQLRDQQRQLASRYAARIDSLKTLQNDPDYSGDPAMLNDELIAASANYLFFSPIFSELSFDPQKVSRMNPDTARDSLEIRLMRDYLNAAATDVDARLAVIRSDRRSIESTVTLSRKAETFLSDVSDENYSVFAQGMIRSQRTAQSPMAEFDDTRNQGLSPVDFSARQLENISIFFAQLGVDRPASVEQSFKMAIESGNDIVSLEEYLNLLKTAEKRLETFRKAITEKLEAEDAAK